MAFITQLIGELRHVNVFYEEDPGRYCVSIILKPKCSADFKIRIRFVEIIYSLLVNSATVMMPLGAIYVIGLKNNLTI